jgi:outer membrane protein TolC
VKQPYFLRLQLLFRIALVVGISGGCTPVDHWSLYDQPIREPRYRGAVEPEIVPVAIQKYDSEPYDSASSAPDLLEEESPELSVEQVVMLALRHNRELHVRQLAPVIAGSFEQIERGRYDPEFIAEAAYFKEKAGENTGIASDLDDDNRQERSITSSLRQALPSGTAIEAGVGQERTVSRRGGEEQTARLQLSVTQSLLQGFSTAVNLASVRQAELETLASVHELRGFTEALLADTEIAYWRYVLANDEIAIFEQSLVVAQKQREEIELSIEVGILPEFEVAAARAEEALRVQALINARSQREDSRLRLLRLISPGPDSYLDRRIRTTSEPRVLPRQITDLSDRLQLAERSRADLSEARLRLRQNRLETIVTRNGLLPRLELFITLGKTGFGETFTDSFRQLDSDTYDFSGGLRLSHFLGNRAAQARNLAAYAGQKQAMEAIANLRQLVHLDVRLAVNEVERLRQQIDASRATKILQEQTTQAEKERFAVGAGTALQVAQAQRDLLSSRIAEVEAIVNYRIALVQLYLVEGSLLERRGIQLSR